ncbi:hypothetical protein BAUCODRAFT_68318 [Baudoinia panamericana UAMH 10762]|uniref:Metallo-beta-lactamase domain-containing protein n=1 Tax=Baudoinia panamericana (strain UAMH 10762) TaxID=717646 RepID=M2ND67_BAUPA|nr:uncharacterized protein BAUCODRAFT_68318 [Baudoinia panamericana UAMH 10762]EMC97149.1 hypothetical protein BAUCODRAFT_68318 [Baudoinia panamericana UAMH 10762]
MSISVRRSPSYQSLASLRSSTHHVGQPATSFRNPWKSANSSVGPFTALHYRFGNHPEKKFVPVPQGPAGSRSSELVKVCKPDWGVGKQGHLRATWIGHASFLVELPCAEGAERGVRILCDPVFSERTSPSQRVGPKRYTPVPCSLEELPDVDVIVISHNHYDHLDHATVQHIYKRRQSQVHFFAGLNNKKWFTEHVGCQPDYVTEADWWDRFEVTVEGVGRFELTCCPAQHGSGRSLFDQGNTLWCSWAIEGSGRKLYFSGDTGYQAMNTPEPCPVFKQIGDALGPFDMALLPIGLMTPASLMGTVHATPEQSINIHKDVKSGLSIGMHYGTVRGGISAQYEPVTAPPRRWRVAAEKEDLWLGGGVEGNGEPVDVTRGGVGLCHVGETVAV